MLSQALSLKKGNDTKPNEDVALADDDLAMYFVTDGVSSTRMDGRYPEPSPGLLAAQAFSAAFAATFQRASKDSIPSLETLKDAVTAGNEAVAIINATRKPHVDYIGIDMACCVATMACVLEGRILLAHLGDGAAYIVRSNTLFRATSDHMAHCRSHFKRDQGEADSEYFRRIRNHYRNDRVVSLRAVPVGYGVFDGDIRAMDFVDYLSVALRPSDRVILMTDGFSAARSTVERVLLETAAETQTVLLDRLRDETDLLISRGDLVPDDRTAVVVDADANTWPTPGQA